MTFLSHLLIAGCDIGVQISVRPFVRPSVRPSTFTSKFDIYIKVFVFSALVIAVTVKPCIVIVLDIQSSTHLDPVSLTYISRSIDFVNFFVEVTSKFGFLCISDSHECETLHSNCP